MIIIKVVNVILIYLFDKDVDKHRNVAEFFLSVNKELFLWMNFGIFIVLLYYILMLYINYLFDSVRPIYYFFRYEVL